MIAIYFTAEPKVADDFLKQVEEWEKEEDYTETDKTVFAVAVACCSWYPEKSAILLKKMSFLSAPEIFPQ